MLNCKKAGLRTVKEPVYKKTLKMQKVSELIGEPGRESQREALFDTCNLNDDALKEGNPLLQFFKAI